MFTMRRKKSAADGKSGEAAGVEAGWNHRHSAAIPNSRNSIDENSFRQSWLGGGTTLMAMGGKHRKATNNRTSLLFSGSSNAASPAAGPNENLIHLVLGPGCFRELRRASGNGSMYSLAIYNLICSLLVFGLRVFNEEKREEGKKGSKRRGGGGGGDAQPVIVLLEAPKIPLKALRIVLKACQCALAYRIRQCILLEPDSFMGFQQRVAMDLLLLDPYDFKIFFCPRQKLPKYLGLSSLYDLQQFWRQNDGWKANTLQDGGWNDLKEGFLNFFAANPSYFANSPGNHCPHPFQPSCARSSASLSRFMRKERTVLIELVEFDLDTVPRPIDSAAAATVLSDKNPVEILKTLRRKHEEKCPKGEAANGKETNAGDIGHLTKKPLTNECHQQQNGANAAQEKVPTGNATKFPASKGLGKEEFAAIVDGNEIAQMTKCLQALLGWLGQHGESRLATLEAKAEQICNTNDGTLEEERQKLANETEKIVNELASITDKLDGVEKHMKQTNGNERPKELIAVGQLLFGAQSRVHGLRMGLSGLSLRMENTKRFWEAVNNFHSEANQLLLNLCSGEMDGGNRAMMPLDANQIGAQIAELRAKMRALEKNASLATEAGTAFCTLLRQNDDQQIGTENGSIKSEQIEQRVSGQMATISERKRRCAQLVDLRCGRLNQRLEIINCEQFGDQILERFNQSLKSNNVKMIEELLRSRRNGKRLVDYARQMAHLAGMLRMINRLESTPNEQFSQRLEALWMIFERKYGEKNGRNEP